MFVGEGEVHEEVSGGEAIVHGVDPILLTARICGAIEGIHVHEVDDLGVGKSCDVALELG